MHPTRATTWLALASLLLGGVAGCAQFTMPEKVKLPGQDDKPQNPLSMTALWTDTVLVEAGVNGFGGRILFYGNDKEKPIKVEGELTVFAYDDTSELPEENVPARKFVFRAEELEKHYSTSKLGHSYSFWIPWDKVGGPQRQISLIARFKSGKGGVVMSEMTRHLLPGTGPKAQAPQPEPEIPLAARMALERAKQQATATVPAAPGIKTTTITLPESISNSTRGAALDAQGENPVSDGATTAAATAKTRADASSANSSDLQALVQELKAMREQESSTPEAPPEDRFARRRHRARIEPKLPPSHAHAVK